MIALRRTVMVACIVPLCTAVAMGRTWTSKDGSRSFEGELESYDPKEGNITVTKKDGRAVTFKFDMLSEADREWVKGRVATEGSKAGDHRDFEIAPKIVVRFRWCPPGESVMGSLETEKWRQPSEIRHKVILTKGFWIAESECTQGQWEAVMGKERNPSQFKNVGKEAPVDGVNWNDIQMFLKKINQWGFLPDGGKANLPTEAQWEYACRAGTKTTFAFGDTLSCEQANFDWDVPYGVPVTKRSKKTTMVVKSFPPNAWGIYDMHGNVFEWCRDGYRKYSAETVTDPVGDMSPGSRRYVRGGSWGAAAAHARSSGGRGRGAPDGKPNSYDGFRIIIELDRE